MEYIFNVEDINREEWASFVYRHPQGNIFQTPQMYDVYNASDHFQPVVGICKSENNINGVLCTAIFSESSGIRGWLTKRSIISGGPLVDQNVKAEEFLKAYDSYIKSKCIYSRIANLFDTSKELGGISNLGYTFQKHLNFLIDLSLPEAATWEKLHNTRRRQVRRGYKRGLEITITDSVEDLHPYYEILKSTYNRVKLPLYDYSFFQNALKIFSPNGSIKIFSAYFEGKLVAHRMVLLYKKMIYDWAAGSLEEASALYPNDILVWEVLKWGINNKYEVFDFGGAGSPDKEYGVRDFKRKFGGEEVCYGNYMKVHQPLKYKLLKAAIKLHNKMRN